MNTTYTVIAALLVLLMIGVILGPFLACRRRSERLQGELGLAYGRSVQSVSGERKAQTGREKRRQQVEALGTRPLAANERGRNLADRTAVQSKRVDEPGQAIPGADRLNMQVVQSRAFPVSDFEQRAAHISVSYPALVSHYHHAVRGRLWPKTGSSRRTGEN